MVHHCTVIQNQNIVQYNGHPYIAVEEFTIVNISIIIFFFVGYRRQKLEDNINNSINCNQLFQFFPSFHSVTTVLYKQIVLSVLTEKGKISIITVFKSVS